MPPNDIVLLDLGADIPGIERKQWIDGSVCRAREYSSGSSFHPEYKSYVSVFVIRENRSSCSLVFCNQPHPTIFVVGLEVP